MSNDFLNKVYDKYEHRDYLLVEDNLNPKREIRASGSSEQEDTVDKTLADISNKLLKIKETYRTAMFTTEDDPELEANTSLSELVVKSKTLNDLKNSLLAGGGVDTSIFRLNDDSSFDESPVIDALIDEIDKMVLQILGKSAGDVDGDGSGATKKSKAYKNILKPSGKSSDISQENKTSSPDQSPSSAKTGYDLTFGDRFNCEKYDTSEDSTKDSESGNSLGGSSSKGTGISSSDASKTSNKDDVKTVAEEMDSLWDEPNDSSIASQADIDSKATDCALSQLGVLKAILVILKIVKVYQKIMTVIGAIIQIINITQLAAGAWLNPTNFAKIAQLIAQKAIALLAQIISRLLQLLWDLLNEECSVKQAMSVWNEIIKSMNAAGQVFDETGNAISLTQNNLVAAAKAKNHLEELTKQMEEKYSLENIKKEAGEWASDSWKDITSVGTSTVAGLKAGLSEATSDIYGKYVPDDLKDMIDQTVKAANSLSAKYEKLAGTKIKTPAVEKALASLKGLKEE